MELLIQDMTHMILMTPILIGQDGFMGIGPLWANNDDGTVYMQGHIVIPNHGVMFPLMVQPPQPQMIQQIKMEGMMKGIVVWSYQKNVKKYWMPKLIIIK